MARPWRTKFEGALYHILSRGNEQQDIFLENEDRNPLRAGLVQRLADYFWSSYPAYAYNKKHPEWLKTDIILKQSNARDKRRAYRQADCDTYFILPWKTWSFGPGQRPMALPKILKVPKVWSELKWAKVKEFCQLYKISGAKRLHNFRHFSSL